MQESHTQLIDQAHYLSGGCYDGLRGPRHPTRVIQFHELIIVRSATLHVFEGEQNYAIGQNEYLYFEPGIEHGALADYEAGLSFYWFHFDLPQGQRLSMKSGHFRRPEIAADLASRLIDENLRTDAPTGSCDYLMRLLLLECGVVQDQEQSDPNGLVDSAQYFIDRHVHQAISARDVAEYCSCHPDHLGRLFKARMHLSLSDAIRQARMRRAQALLRDSKHSIEDIANMSGFSDSHYFRRCFKTAFGVTPSKWRSMHRRAYIN